MELYDVHLFLGDGYGAVSAVTGEQHSAVGRLAGTLCSVPTISRHLSSHKYE
ncbi:MAG: hypothetical protein IJ191_01330 [Treponema sp.]|nr:hypothetical protein [Treponema sp.]